MNMRTMAFAIALTLAQGAVWADGVTRTITPGSGGCEVKLEWSFSGNVESDLVIEERLASGWSVDGSSVSRDSLDAWCCTNSIARFAVNPTNVANGSISFRVSGASSGTVVGTWQLYLNEELQKGAVGGDSDLKVSVVANVVQSVPTTGPSMETQTGKVWRAIPIKSFRIAANSSCELSYEASGKGTLVVEGCEGLGKTWTEVRRVENVPAGDGKVTLTQEEAGTCRFYRMKLLTTEE